MCAGCCCCGLAKAPKNPAAGATGRGARNTEKKEAPAPHEWCVLALCHSASMLTTRKKTSGAHELFLVPCAAPFFFLSLQNRTTTRAFFWGRGRRRVKCLFYPSPLLRLWHNHVPLFCSTKRKDFPYLLGVVPSFFCCELTPAHPVKEPQTSLLPRAHTLAILCVCACIAACLSLTLSVGRTSNRIWG